MSNTQNEIILERLEEELENHLLEALGENQYEIGIGVNGITKALLSTLSKEQAEVLVVKLKTQILLKEAEEVREFEANPAF